MEADRLAKGTGIDLPKLRDAMLMSSGQSWALKDMQLLLNMCDGAGASFPLTGLVKELVEDGRESKLCGDAPGWTEDSGNIKGRAALSVQMKSREAIPFVRMLL